MRTRLPVLIFIAAILSVAGCGGGSSNTGSSNTGSTDAGSTSAVTTSANAATTTATITSGSGTPLPSSRLVAKADAICKRLNIELENSKDRVKTQRDIVRIAPHRVALEQTAVTELSKLTPPASMAQDYQQILTARQTLVEDIKKLGEDAAANNVRAETPIYTSSVTVQRQMAVAAKHSGFKHCGSIA